MDKVLKKMVTLHKPRIPIQIIVKKLITYFVFTIFIAWSPMIVHYFVSYYFGLNFRTFDSYTSDICFMTIILASTNIKDLVESNISYQSLIFFTHIILNIINIALSLLFIGISSYISISGIIFTGSIEKQFNFVRNMYILAVFLGSWVQIGGVLNGKNN